MQGKHPLHTGSMAQSVPDLDHRDIRTMLQGIVREHLSATRGRVLPNRTADMDMLRSSVGLHEAARHAGQVFGLSEGSVATLSRLDRMEAWVDAVLNDVGPRPARLTFLTSGSTGKPVAHTHEMALLWQEVLTQAGLYTDRRRVVGFVPCHHIYGFLFLVLMPKALGVPVSALPPLPTSSNASQLYAGDLAVAFPLFWKGLTLLDMHISPGIVGVTSTGPCPEGVIRALVQRGLERCIEIYGSSETGGIGYRLAPDGEYTLLDYWMPSSDAGQGCSLVRRLPDGGHSQYALPDLVQWTSVRGFILCGRRDNAVQVGGVNVYPDRVRERLLKHSEIADCAVRLMRPEEGDRLKAFVVPRNMPFDPYAFRAELFRWMGTRMTAHEMPRILTLGASLPRTEVGKLADWDV
jgi:4-coumarate--CoA ligase (photoactive yellow protein activation family)